jgi:hypothetical protein
MAPGQQGMIGWFAAGRFEAVNRRWRRVRLRDLLLVHDRSRLASAKDGRMISACLVKFVKWAVSIPGLAPASKRPPARRLGVRAGSE